MEFPTIEKHFIFVIFNPLNLTLLSNECIRKFQENEIIRDISQAQIISKSFKYKKKKQQKPFNWRTEKYFYVFIFIGMKQCCFVALINI